MASWNQLVGFVRQTYQVADTTPDRLSLVFGLSADRSQVVRLLRQVLGENEEEWVQIESPCAKQAPSGSRRRRGRPVTWCAVASL